MPCRLAGPDARVARCSQEVPTPDVPRQSTPSSGLTLLAFRATPARALALVSAAMTVARQRIGRRAEELVAARLAAAGWTIVERNARTRLGELDIVALDGRALVFVEVKAGRAGAGSGPERPALAVDARKRLRIRRVATAWMATRRGAPPYGEIRFDVVGVTFDGSHRCLHIEHIQGAF